jgi:hypothetical protein
VPLLQQQMTQQLSRWQLHWSLPISFWQLLLPLSQERRRMHH